MYSRESGSATTSHRENKPAFGNNKIEPIHKSNLSSRRKSFPKNGAYTNLIECKSDKHLGVFKNRAQMHIMVGGYRNKMNEGIDYKKRTASAEGGKRTICYLKTPSRSSIKNKPMINRNSNSKAEFKAKSNAKSVYNIYYIYRY